MAIAALLCAACGGGGDGTNVQTRPATVSSVRVSPATAAVDVGATQQLSAIAIDAFGVPVTGKAVTWTSTVPAVASVSASGLVTGLTTGTVGVTATIDGIVGIASIAVSIPVSQRCDATQPIAVAETVSGSIIDTDCRLNSGSYADKYVLTLTESTPIRITEINTADAFLILQDAVTGAIVAENDDGNGDTNSRIEQVLPAGRYVIVASTFTAGDFGSYTLSVSRAATACLESLPAVLPDTITGRLAAGACVLPDSSYTDRYALTVTATTILTAKMHSDSLDSFLFIESTDGVSIDRNDNAGGGKDAQVIDTLAPGHYIIYANSVRAKEVGPYTLTLLSRIDQCGVSKTITVGSVVPDTLSASGSCKLADGSFVKRYALSVTVATPVRIDLTSTQFDPYLFLQQAGVAAKLAEDDDSGPGLDAEILQVLAPGDYVISATSATAGESGTFTLSVAGAAPGTIGLSVTPTANTLLPGQTQQLTAAVTGTTNTGVAWQSSAPGIATVSATGVVRGIIAGSATITATSAADPSKTARADITVGAGTAVNLDVPIAYLTQSDQTTDGRFPLIASRATIARVFVRGSKSGLGAAPVRLRLYNGPTLVTTLTGSATIQTASDESCCSADISIPAGVLRDGMTMTADVDPNNTIAESNKDDNAWPLTGVSKPIRVVSVPVINIQLVPIRHRVSTAVGIADTALASLLQRMYPLGVVNVAVHAEYTTDLPALSSTASWVNMLTEIDVLRSLENGKAYYFGVLNQTTAPGIVGIAGVGGFSEVGVGGPLHQAQETLTHEFGHSFGRQHSPTPSVCGIPSGVDTNFPRAEGNIGLYGYDLLTKAVYTPDKYDIMGYCNDTWASDYTYTGILEYLNSGAIPLRVASTAPTPVLLISGALQSGAVSVNPVFTTATAATPQQAKGRFIAEGLASDGRVLFRHRFDGNPVNEAGADAHTFLAAVPYDPAVSGAVATITVRDALGGAAPVTRLRAGTYASTTGGVSLRVDADPQLAVATAAANRFDITWNVSRYPSIVIREATTKRVLAIGRSGALSIAAASLTGLEVLLSDGVSSTTRALSVGGAP